MLTEDQVRTIDAYVPDDYFDREKLKKYLGMHDVVGNEIFAYCVKGEDEWKGKRNRAYAHQLDSEIGFVPVNVTTFIRRAPFYFYVSDFDDIRLFGDLECALSSIVKARPDRHPEILEKLYGELEYMFYDKQIPLHELFSYLIEQFGIVTAPFLQWADYVHLCDELGWKNYQPDCFIYKYNAALEAVGREPIIYEVEDDPYMVDKMYRVGKKIEFCGTFPIDEHGRPELRWVNIKIKNAAAITTNQERSKPHSKLEVELTPRTIIQGKNFYDSWDEDEWYQIYAGPLNMSFDYTVIKSKRKKLGFTQQEVADAIGTTVRTYQKWEGGETTPDGHYLLRLMNWLDLPDPQYVVSYSDDD